MYQCRRKFYLFHSNFTIEMLNPSNYNHEFNLTERNSSRAPSSFISRLVARLCLKLKKKNYSKLNVPAPGMLSARGHCQFRVVTTQSTIRETVISTRRLAQPNVALGYLHLRRPCCRNFIVELHWQWNNRMVFPSHNSELNSRARYY